MSIILDALKKASGTQASTSQESTPMTGNASGTFLTNAESKPKHVTPPTQAKGSGQRTLILLVVALLVVGGFVFMKFGKGIFSLIPFLNQEQKKIEPISMNDLPVAPTNAPVISQVVSTNATQEKITELQNTAASKFNEGKYDESVNAYEKLTHLLPSDPLVYNNYGVALKKTGQIEAALDAYQTALALSPDYAEALNNLAVAQMTQRRYNEARNALERAIALKPAYVDPYLHLGLCLERLGDTVRATVFYEKFLNLSQGEVDRSIRLQVEQRLEELKE